MRTAQAISKSPALFFPVTPFSDIRYQNMTDIGERCRFYLLCSARFCQQCTKKQKFSDLHEKSSVFLPPIRAPPSEI